MEWLDLRALSNYAAVSERTLPNWIHRSSDALPAYQIANKIFVKRSEFEGWIRCHLIRPTGEGNIEEIVNDIVKQVAVSH
jgi:hypothetical protein